jgi:AraC-like DNA-binding protein
MARPPYRPTTDEYRQVRCLKAAGWGERDIARLLGISRETLRKHFAEELEFGRLQCRAEAIEAIYLAGRSAGNLAATKAWLAILDQADAVDRAAERKPDVAAPDQPLRLVAGTEL